MYHKIILVYINGLMLVILFSAACGTLQPTPTTLPPTTTLTSVLAEEEIEWDYVILGDSLMRGVGLLYAEHLENDLVVKVKVHDQWRDNQGADVFLKLLQNNELLRELVSDAEVITFDPGIIYLSSVRICRGSIGTPEAAPDEFESFRAVLRDIFEEIQILRSGSPTIIRVMDYYIPFFSDWRKHGIYEECHRVTEMANEIIQQVAAEYDIPVAHVYDAFNGPNHDEDPIDMGYISPDGLHTSAKGANKIADLFKELGYETIVP